MTRDKLFSVTKSDCEWQFVRGTGKGGQKKNKTSSAVRCIHRESGAVGYAEDTRSQSKNRSIAFKRMAGTKEFKTWHRIETARRLGNAHDIDKKVDEEMKKIKIEVKDNGVWKRDED